MAPGASRLPSSSFTAMPVLLDTNVVSELIRRTPDPNVTSWVSDRPLRDLFFSAVGEAELRFGVAILPTGRRRDALNLRIEAMLADAFGDRVLPFDRDAARAYGNIAAMRRSAGRPVAPMDCQMAAVAASRGLAVATRNVRDFEHMGIEIVNPWTAE